MRTWYATQLGMLGVEDTYTEQHDQPATKPLIVHLAEIGREAHQRRKYHVPKFQNRRDSK